MSSARNQDLPWTDNDLQKLLKNNRRDIGEIVRSILECKHGDLYSADSMMMLLHEIGIKGEVLVVDLGNCID